MALSNTFASISPTIFRGGLVMDTEELYDQLRDIASTGSIDASADRDSIENRAPLYRRHRRSVASVFVAVGIAAVIVVVMFLVNNNDGRRSVRVPPAQS